jgi:hypothetical protein
VYLEGPARQKSKNLCTTGRFINLKNIRVAQDEVLDYLPSLIARRKFSKYNF